MRDRSNPHAAQIRLAPATPIKTAGQRKHDLRIGKQPAYVDADKSSSNRVLIAPKTATEMSKRAGERRARKPRKRAMKSNASVSFSGIITFGHLAHLKFEQLTPEQQDAAFLDLAQSVADSHKVDLTGLVVHVDEAGLHAHFQMDAYDETGNALSDEIDCVALRKVQDMAGEVMGRHAPGIERGHRKLDRLEAGANYDDVTYKKPAAMRRAFAQDIEDAEFTIGELEEDKRILRNRVSKLEAYESDLSAKGKKQLEIAQRRLEAKEAAIQETEATLERLRQSTVAATEGAQKAAESLDEAKAEHDALEARMKPLRDAVAALDAHEASERDREQAELKRFTEQARFAAIKDLFGSESDARVQAGVLGVWAALEPNESQTVRAFIQSKKTDGPLELRDRFDDLSPEKFNEVGTMYAELERSNPSNERTVSEIFTIASKVNISGSWTDLASLLMQSTRQVLSEIGKLLAKANFDFTPQPTPSQAKPAADLSDEIKASIRKTGQSGPGL